MLPTIPQEFVNRYITEENIDIIYMYDTLGRSVRVTIQMYAELYITRVRYYLRTNLLDKCCRDVHTFVLSIGFPRMNFFPFIF